MAYTLLALIQQSANEMGLEDPSAVISSSNNQTVQLLALCQRLGKDLVREFEWQRLVKAYVFQATATLAKTGNTTSGSAVISSMNNTTSLAAGMVARGTGIPSYAEISTVDSGTQVTLNMPATATGTTVTLNFDTQDYSLPSDFDRMVKDTQWDRTNYWRNLGSQSSQSWQWLQGGVVASGPRKRFRLYQNSLRLFEAPTAADNYAYEYVSNFWVIASGGTAATKATFTADTDTNIWPDDLMLAGLKYYFLKAKKLDFGIEFAEFQEILSTRKAQDVPLPTLSLAPTMLPELVGPWSIQDGNWPTS